MDSPLNGKVSKIKIPDKVDFQIIPAFSLTPQKVFHILLENPYGWGWVLDGL
jgi:hypothetical protein